MAGVEIVGGEIAEREPELDRSRRRRSRVYVIGSPTYGTHFRLAQHARHESDHGKKQKQRVDKCYVFVASLWITCTYRRCMAGVEIVGGEDVVLVVDLMVVDLGVVLMWDVIDEYDD